MAVFVRSPPPQQQPQHRFRVPMFPPLAYTSLQTQQNNFLNSAFPSPPHPVVSCSCVGIDFQHSRFPQLAPACCRTIRPDNLQALRTASHLNFQHYPSPNNSLCFPDDVSLCFPDDLPWPGIKKAPSQKHHGSLTYGTSALPFCWLFNRILVSYFLQV